MDGRRGGRRQRGTLVAVASIGALVLAACGRDDGAPTARRSDAIESAIAPEDEAAPDTGLGGEAGAEGVAGADAIVLAAGALIATPIIDETCPLFGDPAAIIAPYGTLESLSTGPGAWTVDGVDVPTVYCNISSSGGLVSFSLAVTQLDAAAIVDADTADPDVASGTVTGLTLPSSLAVGGSLAGVCIEDADVTSQCRYVWANGAVALKFADIPELDPDSAVSVLETAVEDLLRTLG